MGELDGFKGRKGQVVVGKKYAVGRKAPAIRGDVDRDGDRDEMG